MKILFFGAGNMASILGAAFLKTAPDLKLYFYTPSKNRAKELAQSLSAHFVENLSDIPSDIDWYFLTFKPQNLKDFDYQFKKTDKIVSVLAGTEIQTLKNKFMNENITRVMPNTPTKVFAGMNLVYFDQSLTEIDCAVMTQLLMSCGEVEVLKKESIIDTLTPFTGSLPGIIFELAAYIENSLKKHGINDVDSRKLIAQTFFGSSKLMINSNSEFATLCEQVTSKKGVTFAALESMRENNINQNIDIAFDKALNRIEEMKRGI